MIEVSEIGELRAWRRAQREQGRRVGFVPTMGYLHDGHLSLVDRARAESDIVAMSIFVNPLQFAAGEDFSRYPRNLERDRALARERGVSLLFVPSVETMYPAGSEVRVTAGPTAALWEGAARPGHFDGVLTIVAKLFHLVEPDVACFGQKDVQQVTVVRRMVRDLDWPLRIDVAPTWRDADGLAMSSRNVYLNPDDRRQALGLSRALFAARDAFAAGERSAEGIRAAVAATLALHPGIAADYIAIVESEGLTAISSVDSGTIVAVAGRVGTTRLIDNVILGAE